MSINWISAYNRLLKVINTQGNTYYSGSKFIQIAQQVDDSIPNYNEFIKQRRLRQQSTSRKDFYWDIINSLEETQKYQLFYLFIEALEPYTNNNIESVKSLVFGGGMTVPTTIIPQKLWNSEKLNSSLKEIDNAIDAQQFNRAVTLAYTCLEGLYKTYVKENIPEKSQTTEVSSLPKLSKLVKDNILEKLKEDDNYPKEIIHSISTITNGIANSRNSFSESHFSNDANKWLAIYVRDLTNSIGRLLLNFKANAGVF